VRNKWPWSALGCGTEHKCGDTWMFLQHDLDHVNGFAGLYGDCGTNAHFVKNGTRSGGHKLLSAVARFFFHRRLHAAPGDKICLFNERKDMHRSTGFGSTTRRKPQRKPGFFGLIDDN
jgi:hypothetical protein